MPMNLTGRFRMPHQLMMMVMGFAMLATMSCSQFNKLKAKLGISSNAKSVETTKSSDVGGKNQTWSYFKVQRTSIFDMVQIDGKLEASERIEMRADKRMRISPAKFKVGDRVRRGDVLFVVDTKEFEQKRTEAQERVAQLNVDIKTAKAQFTFAAKQMERKTALVAKGIAAQKELEEAQKGFVAAESDLKTKELELRKAERELATAKDTVASANVVSAIEGIVSTIVPGGDDVNQGQSLATIANPAQLAITGAVDESSVTKFTVGQKVDVIADAVPTKSIQGIVKSIDTAMQQRGNGVNSYNVVVAIPPEVVTALNLRDGYSAKIRAVFSSKEKTLVIPRSGLKQNGNSTFALVAGGKDQSPSARVVKVGIQTELESEILDGLQEGEFVAVSSDQEAQKL